MARSALQDELRARRRGREARLSPEALSERMEQLAQDAVRDYADTHGVTYGEAKRRLDAAKRAGRTPTSVLSG